MDRISHRNESISGNKTIVDCGTLLQEKQEFSLGVPETPEYHLDCRASFKLIDAVEIVMIRYPALIDGEKGICGVSFPDIPGVVSMGATVDEALLNAQEALLDYVIETEKAGDELVSPSSIEEVETPVSATLLLIPLNCLT